MSIITLPQDAESRPWYKRLTIVWGAITAGLLTLEPAGVIEPGTVAALASSITQIGTGFLTLIGLYRQVAS